MKSRIFIALAAALAPAVCWGAPLSSPPGFPAQITWTREFNFDSDPTAEGWQIVNNTSGQLPPPANARWINPSVEPNGPVLPDQAVSGTSGLPGNTFCGPNENGCKGVTGGGSIYLPGYDGSGGDESVAMISAMNLHGVASMANWAMQADVYMPNLAMTFPPAGFRGFPGNAVTGAGIQAWRADGRAVTLEGAAYNEPPIGFGVDTFVRFRDFGVNCASPWYNTWLRGDLQICPPGINPIYPVQTLEHGCTVPKSDFWNRWITLFIDYDFLVRGKVQAWIYVPWDGPGVNCGCSPIPAPRQPGWFRVFEGAIAPGCTEQQARTMFVLGGKSSWTHAQFDNVKFALPDICHEPFADFDDDGDVDQDDFGHWQACQTGPGPLGSGVSLSPACFCFDREKDGDVDNDDYADFTQCASGPDVLANVACDD